MQAFLLSGQLPALPCCQHAVSSGCPHCVSHGQTGIIFESIAAQMAAAIIVCGWGGHGSLRRRMHPWLQAGLLQLRCTGLAGTAQAAVYANFGSGLKHWTVVGCASAECSIICYLWYAYLVLGWCEHPGLELWPWRLTFRRSSLAADTAQHFMWEIENVLPCIYHFSFFLFLATGSQVLDFEFDFKRYTRRTLYKPVNGDHSAV